FAAYYAARVASQLGIEPDVPSPPDDPGAARIQLNDWGPSESTPAESETYAYAASLELAGTIASRAGADAMQQVWTMAANGVGAYQPSLPGATPTGAAMEPAEGPPDWRSLLDLLEDVTGKDFVDL